MVKLGYEAGMKGLKQIAQSMNEDTTIPKEEQQQIFERLTYNLLNRTAKGWMK